MERVERVFDSMDYNNQRNLLWSLVEIEEEGKSRYNPMLVMHIQSNPQLGAIIHLDEVYTQSRKMAMRLTECGEKTKLSELMEAA